MYPRRLVELASAEPVAWFALRDALLEYGLVECVRHITDYRHMELESHGSGCGLIQEIRGNSQFGDHSYITELRNLFNVEEPY